MTGLKLCLLSLILSNSFYSIWDYVHFVSVYDSRRLILTELELFFLPFS